MGYNITNIDGDLALGRNAEIGGDVDIHGKARVAGNLKVEGFFEAPNIKGVVKGLFVTEEELKREYPNPRPGWCAIVLADDESGFLYLAKNREWEKQSEEAQPFDFIVDSINVFASKGELADETARAQEAERFLAQGIVNERTRAEAEENEIKQQAVKYDRTGFTKYADKINFFAGSIDGSVLHYAEITSATHEMAGVMTAEDKTNLDNSTIRSITWNNDNDPSNMNDFVVAGVYNIKGEHKRVDDNLPILNTGGGHSFNARLTVLDSSITGTGDSQDKCITQVLTLSNRTGEDGNMYIRTGHGGDINSLSWESWAALQTNINVGDVDNLDNLKDNGIYSGVWTKGSYNAYPLTFVCIVINDYFVGVAPRRISQFVYGLSKLDGSTVYQSRVWDDSKNAWGDWEILNQKKISSMISTEIGKLVDKAPETFDTLKEIADWIESHDTEVVDIIADIKANANNLAETKKDIANQLIVTPVADKVSITGRNMQSMRLNFGDIIPAATEENAGVMTAEDKKTLSLVDVESNLSKVMSKSNTIATSQFIGGSLLNDESSQKGLFKIGAAISATPVLNASASSIVKYTSTSYSTLIGLRPKKGFTEHYRWAALFDKDNKLVVELACDAPDASYVLGLPQGWTIVSSCDTYLNPEILDVNKTLSDINENVENNLQASAVAIQSMSQVPFTGQGYIWYDNGDILSSGATSGATPYISTKGISEIYTTSVIGVGGAKVAFYDKDLNYLKDISISGADTNTNYIFTDAQKNAAYFRVSYYGASDSDKVKRGILKLKFSDGRVSIDEFSDDIESVKTEAFDLKLNSEGISFTDYFDLSTNNLAAYQLHQLPLKAGKTFVLNVIKSDAKFSLVVIYKGESKGYAIATDLREGTLVEFTPEKDVDYVGYYLFKVEGNTNAEVSVNIATAQAISAKTLAAKPILDILIFGDSITQSRNIEYKSLEEPYSTVVSGLSGTNWAKILEERKQLNNSYKLGEIRNYAKSGASFRDRSLEPRQYLGFQIDEAFADLDAPSDGYYYNKSFNPNVVIVSIGTNDGTPASSDTYENAMSKTVMKDVGDGEEIGIQETLDNLDTSATIGEAIRHSFMRLREKFPNALLVYATPIQRLAYETPSMQLELFKSLAKRYNFVIADCNTESGIVRDFQTWDGSSGDLRDGLHPTENGSKKILRCIMNTVINNIQYLPR